MSEYVTIFEEHLEKFRKLGQERRRIQAETEKVVEMLKASFGMMSDDERTQFVQLFVAATTELAKEELGLTEAIRKLLESSPKEWFDAIKVRDRLMASCFDFSHYTSNPLASVHAVLKRFKRKEVKTRQNAAGLKEYRFVTTRVRALPNMDEAPIWNQSAAVAMMLRHK